MLLPVPVYLREVSQNLRRSRPRACERRHGSCAGSNWISRLHPWRTDDVLRPWKDIHSEEACRQWMVDVAQGSRRLFGWRFGRSLGDDRGLASTTHIHVPKRSPQQHQCHSTPLSTSLHPSFERYTRRNALGLILASSCRIYIQIFSSDHLPHLSPQPHRRRPPRSLLLYTFPLSSDFRRIHILPSYRFQPLIFNMLRRAPTTITITSADLEIYEANRQRKNYEKKVQQQQQQQQDSATQSDSSSEKEHEHENAKPTQKDRILGEQRRGN